MRFVLYSLDWRDGVGRQPYEQVAMSGASLDGGLAVHYGRYLGRISGKDEQIQAAIDGCIMFGMVEITDEQAKEFEGGKLPG